MKPRALVFWTLILAGKLAGAQTADGGPLQHTLGAIDRAFAAHDLDGILAAYDPAAAELVARTKADAQGWLALADARLTHRITQVTTGRDRTEAVVLRRLTFTEHGRPQIDLRWETVGVRQVGADWRIVSAEERRSARTLHIDLGIALAPEAGTMRGTARLDVEVLENGEDSLLLALNRGLEIKTLTDGKGRPVHFERTADGIEVPEDGRLLRAGDQRTLEVTFAGKLFNEAKEQGFSQVAISPGGSFASWVTSFYPHLAGSGSKAKGRLSYDVPAGVTVASSGRLVTRTTEGGRTREIFVVDQPLDFSFAAAPYFVREATVDGTHLGVYLLSGGEAKAALYMKEAARTLRCERSLYGPYPFDGYAVVEIPSAETGTLGGSSEQGMNLFPVGVLPDDEFPLLLLGHEIGHSWWGNLVGSGDGPILDEGLAQISAVLCLRASQGEPAMRAFLENGVPGYQQSAAQYFARFAGPGKDVPLGRPPAGSDAAAALHDLADTKGMFVYAMLRDEIGADAFVNGLRAVARKFAEKTVRLADLRAAWEAASKTDLKTFFAQWLERTGAPELALESKIEAGGSGFVVTGVITQVGDTYDADVEVALGVATGREIKRISIHGPSTPFSFSTAVRPTFVVLDPDYKILRWTPELRHASLLAEGLAIASTGHRAEGCAVIDAFVAVAPDSLEGRYRAGVCAEEAGRLADAERSFREVVARRARLGRVPAAVTRAALHLGFVLDLAGRRDEARAAYRQVLDLPDAGAHDQARAGLTTPHVVPAPTGPGRDVLARFAAAYDDGQGVAIDVKLNELGVLVASSPGRPTSGLAWLEGARFVLPARNGMTVEFIGTPEVTGLDITIGGQVLHLARTKK